MLALKQKKTFTITLAKKLITGPMQIKYANTCSGILPGSNLSASLALLSLLRLGSSLTLVLLLLLRPSWSTLRRVHLFCNMRSYIFLRGSYSVFQLWNLDSNVFHQ